MILHNTSLNLSIGDDMCPFRPVFVTSIKVINHELQSSYIWKELVHSKCMVPRFGSGLI